MTIAPPLIALMSGSNARPRRAVRNVPRESVLHFAVAKLLRDHCLEDWRWTHIPSGELRDIRTASKLKQMGVRRGFPDFIFISPYGSVRFLELKRAGGELTEEQAEFRLWCIKHGVPHVIAWSIDQVLTSLDQWGVLRIKIASRGE
jgi:hypothetical protein